MAIMASVLTACYGPSDREPDVSVDLTPVYEYKDATEALLDMIREEWEDFDDVVYGSREYKDYLMTRDEADKVEVYVEEYDYDPYVRGFP